MQLLKTELSIEKCISLNVKSSKVFCRHCDYVCLHKETMCYSCWSVTPSSLVEMCRRFGGNCCFCSQN